MTSKIEEKIYILPYCKIQGQEALKTALEIAYISGPRIGGVLISGHRGTGKSTIVRAFSKMMFGELPITLPINATEDRVVGGWRVDALMEGRPEKVYGLLVDANKKILYIDEVNLLDDHIVNIILDTAASGILSVQRQGIDLPAKETQFILVGTMNPDEGYLRPQLQDRFGLIAQAITESEHRSGILKTVLEFDEVLSNAERRNNYYEEHNDNAIKSKLILAKDRLNDIQLYEPIIVKCIELAEKFNAVGHRVDYVLALAARALAAHRDEKKVTLEHLSVVAPLALSHRRAEHLSWTEKENSLMLEILGLS